MSIRSRSDQELSEELQVLLDVDKNLRSYGLTGDVVDGTARLSGVVDTLAEKEYAEKLAQGIPGVERVESAISLSTDGPITDKETEFEVSEELAADPRVDLKKIGARSSKGVVTLVGRASSPAEIQAARRAAKKARGVTQVRSRVKLEK